MRKTLKLFIVILLLGCANEKENDINILFPRFNVSLEDLINTGYKKLSYEELLWGRKYGDTLLYYQFSQQSDMNSKPKFQICSFPIKSFEIDTFDYFFSNRSYYRFVKPEDDGNFIRFCIKNSIYNFYFECEINKKDSIMHMFFGYPQIPD